jgi:hypothetical protein
MMLATAKRSTLLALAVIVAVSAVPADLQSNQADSDGFGVRNAHALVYDSNLRRTILFGGADERRVLNDTRAWHPSRQRWLLITDSGPAPRTFPAMAYDQARGAVVLVGGNRVLFGSDLNPPAFLADTWLLQGDVWRRWEGPGPPARAEASIAYDARRAVVVLFGGYARDATGSAVRFGDTWEWNGEGWRQKATTGPAPRNGAAMAYDARVQRVVLFGGRGAANDMWEWDGQRWSRRPTGDVPGRYNAAMVFDSARRRLLRFGGWSGETRTGDTWLFTDDWSRLDGEGPSPRNHAAIAFDSDRGRAVLVGGHDGELVFGDTWEFDGQRWIPAAAAQPLRRVPNQH